MSNILLLDLGNSRLKWAVYASTDIQQAAIKSGVINVTDITAEELQKAWQALPELKAAYISAVGQQAMQALCVDVLITYHQIELQTIKVGRQVAGVQNSYKQVQNLGVDRWMGLLAAHKLSKKSAIVVSCGTATTIDVINAEGEHQGGYIVPGIALMHESLGAATANNNIHDVKEQTQSLQLGTSTHQAIGNGILQMQIALIEKVYAENSAESLDIYLTGGAAEQISPFLRLPYQLELAMVFKGMQVYIHAE